MSASAAPDSPKRPRNVHVLFVHGVGQHSRLSSLLRPYQAIRSNLRSLETPVGIEDRIPAWRLADLQEAATPPHLKLVPRYPVPPPSPAESIYFYEVNYSSLAGVVRENHPLDLTLLFVGFDLAVNIARGRLRTTPPRKPGSLALGHSAIAECVQGLAGVLVAATVPILGVPALLLRNYTRSFVSTYTRFFEDIATFAMDKDGEQLVSAHFDRTVRSILESARFMAGDERHHDDVFVVAAHSLGTVVAHNYLVRHWERGGRGVPSTVLTFGSPIGLVCWLWLFLDYPGMVFDPEKEDPGDNYFCWNPRVPTIGPLPEVHWINVVNHLDPIATAFPIECVDLLRSGTDLAKALAAGDVDTRFIRTGGVLSAGSAHTAYFDDRAGFIDVLNVVARLQARSSPSSAAAMRTADEHWRQTLADLEKLRAGAWWVGLLFLTGYFFAVAAAYDRGQVLALMLPYSAPPATIAFLAFFQRLFFGGPTKRTHPADIRGLSVRDTAALAYRLRARLPWLPKKVDPDAPGPNPAWRLLRSVVSFVPTAVAMVAPAYAGYALSENGQNPFTLMLNHPTASLALFGIFILYIICLSVSEFAANWRATVVAVREDGGSRETTP